MTAAEALQRLRTTGRLSTLPMPRTALTAADLDSAPAKAVDRLISSRAAGRQRWLASSTNLPVLP